jgi:hypothetical protein
MGALKPVNEPVFRKFGEIKVFFINIYFSIDVYIE